MFCCCCCWVYCVSCRLSTVGCFHYFPLEFNNRQKKNERIHKYFECVLNTANLVHDACASATRRSPHFSILIDIVLSSTFHLLVQRTYHLLRHTRARFLRLSLMRHVFSLCHAYVCSFQCFDFGPTMPKCRFEYDIQFDKYKFTKFRPTFLSTANSSKRCQFRIQASTIQMCAM